MTSPLRILINRRRLVLSIVAGMLVAMLIPSAAGITRALIGWNVAVGLYLALIAHVIFNAKHDAIMRHSREQDEGRLVILSGSMLAAAASVGAIVALLAASRNVTGLEQAWHLSLAFATILSAWSFVHVCFAMHYAHIYYDASNLHGRKGLVFPGHGEAEPDYEDFLYFSLTIGVASQTSDVTVTTKAMRRIVLLHGVLSFFFNTAVLALTINIAASLI